MSDTKNLRIFSSFDYDTRIPMEDKFFHGIEWDSNDDVSRIEILNNILKFGKLLSYKDRCISDNDRIYFSVKPDSIYKDEYDGNEMTKDIYTGFDMTSSTFYLIFDKKIKELLQKGFYRLECFSTVSIDIKDYLVGVGNTGYNVDPDIEFCYLYTLFLNKEISEEELKASLREVYCDYSNKIEQKIRALTQIADKWIGNTEYNENVLKARINEPEKLLQHGLYNEIKDTFDKNNIPIKYYDNNGYLIKPENELKKAKIMKAYIEKNAKYIPRC